MRITEDEYKAVQDAPDPQPLSGGAWPAAQSSYGPSYQSDGLGHYSTDGGATWMNDSGGQYQEPPSTGLGNYNLGFGGSPVTSYATPDANSDGLNDTTGWAMGVEQDQNSPTGFSYNGAPVSSNGAPYTPPTYQQPGGDWYNYDNQPALNNAPFQDPGYESPWNPSYMKDQGGGGFLGGLKDFIQPGINAVVNNPVVGAGMIAGNAANDFIDNLTGTSRQQRINDQLSGNALVHDVSGGNVDLNQLPYGLGYVTDAALAPASYLGWGATGGAGATAWEGVKQIGSGALGNAAAKFGASDTAAQIPVYGDQPAWLRGLEAGAVGGIAGYGAIGGIGNAAKEAGGFGPLLKSEVGSTPPLGKGGLPEPNAPRGVGPDGEILPEITGGSWDRPSGTARQVPGVKPPKEAISPEGRWVTGNDAIGVTPFHEGAPTRDVHIASDGTVRAVDKTADSMGQFEVVTFKPTGPGQWEPSGYEYFPTHEAALASVQPSVTQAVTPPTDTSLNPRIGNAAKEAGGFGPLLKSEVGESPPLFPKGGKPLTYTDTREALDDAATSTWYQNVANSNQRPVEVDYNGVSKRFTPEGGVPAGLPSEAVPTDTSLNPIRRQIADALDNELKFRNSGEAEAIKAVKRGEQAAGINLAQAGNTSAETLANVSAGAKVGQFFDKTPGLKLPEEQYNAALKDVLDSTEGFDKLQAVKALDKLQNGQRLQPGEIKTLGKLYGPEIEAKIRATNADRIQTVAELTPEDIAKINRQAEVDGKRVATLEVQSQRQHELADNLQKQLNMDPTNKALKKAAEDARARGLAQQNTADRLLADRAEKLTANLPSRTETQILRTEQAATGTAKAAEQADKVALRNESKAFFKASPEQAVTNAKNVVAKLDVPDSLKSQLIDTIEIGARKQSLILDGMGDSGPGILRKIYASATGEVTDSYTSKLLTQRAFMENALQSGGLSKEASKAIGKLLQDAELRQRFGNAIPDYVTKSLDEAKFNFSEGGAIKGLADISQELKNTQFGIGDVAVFGQQAAKAGLTNAPQIVTGYVNRALQALHLGGVNTAIPEASIARDTQYALDGLALHSHAITDIVSNERTLLSRLGAPGRIIDQSVALPIIKKLTDFQFDTVLGNLRKTIYEGNLVMAHLSGADISNPAVRLRSAEMANAATGAGKLAQRSARANAEKAFLLSPSMRRAQIQQMTQVIKGLSHQDTALTSALAITSSVGLTLGVGKLLSDYLNLPFETDPSKPGFGNIRLPDGTTVNPFSQEQIAKAFARSLRILAEDPSTDGAKRISEEWGKILVSSASPGLRPILASMGVGIDQNGYHWGDLGQGQSLGQRVLNAAPIPPLAQSIIQNGVSPVRTPLETLGFNAYPESKYAKRAQELGPNPTEKQLFDYEQKNGRIYSSDPTIKAQQVEADRAHQEQLDRQNARDTELTTGTWSPAKATQWREQRKQDNLYFAGRFDQLYSGVNFKDSNVTDVDRYYKAIADNTDRVTGDINWDAVDAATKGLNQEYIKANTNLRDTSIEKSYRTALDTIESSGYFNRQEQTWAKVQKYSDEAKAYPDYYAWKDAKLEEQTQKFMDRYGYDKLYAAAMAEKAVNASAPEKIYDGYSKQWKADWVMQNPAAAYQAWTWGYYTPTDDMKAYLNKWAKGQ